MSGPARSALENSANNSSPLLRKTASDLRERRYSARGLLWQESGLERVRQCGRVAVTPGGSVALRLRSGVAGFAGLSTCSSVWADPVCNAKIMARRAVEIGAAVEVWQARGGRVAFVTLTMRHRRGQRLATLWDGLSKAWAKVTSGKGWVTDRERHGVAGWLRVVEVTHGSNGWHVHVHSLLFLDPGLVEPDLAGLHASMFGRWSRALVRSGLARPLMVGQDAKLVAGAADSDLAAYFTKAVYGSRAIGLEFTQTQSKSARSVHGTRAVWGLLDDVLGGDADALDLWHEWERGSRGRRQLTWSKGMRQALQLGAEATDEDIAEEEVGTAQDDLVLITAEGWRVVVAGLHMARLLGAAEAGGLAAVRAVLDSIGAEWVPIGGRSAA